MAWSAGLTFFNKRGVCGGGSGGGGDGGDQDGTHTNQFLQSE